MFGFPGVSSFLCEILKDRLFFVYSSAHFEDLMRSKGDPRFESDLRMLTDLAGDHFLDIDHNGITHPYRVLPEQISKDYSEPQYFNHQDIDSLIESVKEIPIVGIRIDSDLWFAGYC